MRAVVERRSTSLHRLAGVVHGSSPELLHEAPHFLLTLQTLLTLRMLQMRLNSATLGLEMEPMTRTENDASERADFYQTHLDRVSRSFAFCIARLDRPLREWVGLSYLLCRLVDTIEDAAWAEFGPQNEAFDRFDDFIERQPSNEEVGEWVRTFPVGLPEGEKELLADSVRLFQDFHALPFDVHESLKQPILSMSRGMRYFMEEKGRSGRLVLTSIEDVNRYCFFVAGVVGEMLTKLVWRGSQPNLSNAFRFGLFLQKVNLLKDQSGDERVGRSLVPDRSLVLASLLDDADRAYEYFRNLPKRETGFRLFCGWSLYLGLASLPWIERSYDEASQLKIPRDETFRLLGLIEENLESESELDKLFADLLAKIPRPTRAERTEPASAVASDERSRELLARYSGSLPVEDALKLFQG